MSNKALIPEGFKDQVDFNTNVEHEYKNKIINIFISNGFNLVKPPLIEFLQNKISNSFLINTKKKEQKLFIRDDITPQIIRIASSRFKNKTRPIKLCYYGEVIRKQGTMLRPERQFLQVGSEIIGSSSILADIEIINLAYKSLKEIGVKNITLELTSNKFMDEIFSEINDIESLNKLKMFIKLKDINNSIAFIKNKKHKIQLEHLFKLTGNLKEILKKINTMIISDPVTEEIEKIKNIIKKINFKKDDQIILNFTEFKDKNYHDGVRFTFFARDVRGEIASGGRYKINTDLKEESAVGFTCFMDTILRASSFENSSKKILIPFDTEEKIKNNLIKKNYIICCFFGNTSDIDLFANQYECTHVFKNNKIKKI